MNEDSPESEDTLSVLVGAISHYGTVLRGALAKDSEAVKEMANLQGDPVDDVEVLCSGEITVLDLLCRTLEYSRTVMEMCVKHLLDEKLVSPAAVVRWSLGDSGDEKIKGSPIRRWWVLAEKAVIVGVKHGTAVPADSNQMAVDAEDDGEANADKKKSQKVVDIIAPLLSLVVRRACALYSSHDASGSKINPEQVDILEGVKRLVCSAHDVYKQRMMLSEDKSRRELPSELIESFEESAVSGQQLALMCSGRDGIAPVESLRRLLERI